MKAFGWSLREIDETDIETLLPFINRMTETGPSRGSAAGYKTVYADEVGWL